MNSDGPEASEREQKLAATERQTEEENQRYPFFGEPERQRRAAALDERDEPGGTEGPIRAGKDHPQTRSEPFRADEG